MANKKIDESRAKLLAVESDFSDEEDIELVELTNENKRFSTAYGRPFISTGKSRKTSVWGLLGAIISLVIVTAYYIYRKEPPYGESPPWYPTPQGGTHDSWAESYTKAADLVRKMSLLEKVNVTTGVGWASDLCVGNTGPASITGFPSLCFQDGPLGIRFADHITAFPAGLTVAASWNRDLMYRRGRAHAKEAKGKGVNVLLGPSMGPIGRMPAAGRNWEGFGADPVLEAIAASQTIRGIQDEGVQATAKHLIAQEQEHFRQPGRWGTPHAISSNVDDRTLHELYLWPFAESIRTGVASIMCSYQQVNNSYACGNAKLMNGILKDELGFQGYVQSDWLAQRGGVSSALAGLDVTMPGDGLWWANGRSLWGDQLTLAVLNGSVPVGRLDDMVTRVVAAWFQLGQDKWNTTGPNFSSWTNEETGLIHHSSGENVTGIVNKFIDVQGSGEEAHAHLVKEIAAEGNVLVKNVNGILPLDRRGSSMSTASNKLKVGIFGEDAGEGQGPNACEDRACNQGTLASGWGSGSVEFPYLIAPMTALQKEFDQDRVNVTEYLINKPPPKSLTTGLDLCLVFVNSDSGEGYLHWEDVKGDRPNLDIQKNGNALVETVAKDCGSGKGKTIVIVHAVGPVNVEPWADLERVDAIILAHLPGQESGNALTSVLFGDIDASGRLPYTVGRSLKDYGPGGEVMYTPNGLVPQQDFEEGLLIDYRYFDKHAIQPRYEFGYGLSYTTFEYSNLKLKTIKKKSAFPNPRQPGTIVPPNYDTTIPDPQEALVPSGFHLVRNRIYPYIRSVKDVKKGTYPYPEGYHNEQPPSPAGGAPGGNPSLYEEHLSISFTIKNTGSRAGKDVAQIYVRFPPDGVKNQGGEQVSFPPRVLRQFEKVELQAGQSKTIEVKLTRKDLSYWDVWAQNWIMPEMSFGIDVGRSSREIVLQDDW
ncbi:MAG: hypothetical protein GOMPHAMPRED_005905 [Gomphillus americanus]|uniref:Probable beta-glucosidase E n=1 Tax=Gomphillus americanus TaxID=1940652 RepID=A0A8H3FWL3_9LECA|nr:MAG: hypothetical protein GOMPHAMPRED_005905 [Gomphillus americanus]